jgi:hypothetical protein
MIRATDSPGHFIPPTIWGYQTYAPPTSGRGNDWILILEDEAAGFPLLGTAQASAPGR